MAKATLTEATNQTGGSFVTLDGVLLALEVEADISAHAGMLYMDSHNIKVDFVKEDFNDISEGTLENIALKLEVDADKVKETLFGKKSAAAKVKETLTGSKKQNKKSAAKAAEVAAASSIFNAPPEALVLVTVKVAEVELAATDVRICARPE